MTKTVQHEAHWLLNNLDHEDAFEVACARELRRLHAENEDFRATIDHLTRENAEQIGEIVVLKERRDELLEALRNLADLYDTDKGCRSLPEYIAARAAIAKATGETK